MAEIQRPSGLILEKPSLVVPKDTIIERLNRRVEDLQGAVRQLLAENELLRRRLGESPKPVLSNRAERRKATHKARRAARRLRVVEEPS